MGAAHSSKVVSTWDEHDVSDALFQLSSSFSGYAASLAEAGVNGEAILSLNTLDELDACLHDLSVKPLHRARFKAEFKALQARASQENSGHEHGEAYESTQSLFLSSGAPETAVQDALLHAVAVTANNLVKPCEPGGTEDMEPAAGAKDGTGKVCPCDSFRIDLDSLRINMCVHCGFPKASHAPEVATGDMASEGRIAPGRSRFERPKSRGTNRAGQGITAHGTNNSPHLKMKRFLSGKDGVILKRVSLLHYYFFFFACLLPQYLWWHFIFYHLCDGGMVQLPHSPFYCASCLFFSAKIGA